MTCASHAREFAHGMFEATRGTMPVPYIRDALPYIIILLLDFAISSEPKLL